jgi:hypothetical protein
VSAWNAGVADLLGPHSLNIIWGGSWAIRRDNFESAQVRQAWQGVLTEDLTTWQALRRARLPVCYEPACLVASPLRATWPQIIEFARRQYFLVHKYAPRIWWWAVAAGVLPLVAFWGGLGLALANWLTGAAAWWALMPVGVIYLLEGVRAAMRQAAAVARFPQQTRVLRRAWLCDVLLHPLLRLSHWTLIVSAGWMRQVTWRGIRYRVHDATRMEILRPAPRGDAADAPLAA